MQTIEILWSGLLLAATLLAQSAFAQAHDSAGATGKMDMAAFFAANPPKPAAPATEPSIPLLPTGTADSETWATMLGHRTVRNVTQPAIYPRPAAAKANGTALVIAPGGAFLSLSFDTEGMMLAKYLAERGVTCFVLKYQLDPTPKDVGDFMRTVGQRMGERKAAHAARRPDRQQCPSAGANGRPCGHQVGTQPRRRIWHRSAPNRYPRFFRGRDDCHECGDGVRRGNPP